MPPLPSQIHPHNLQSSLGEHQQAACGLIDALPIATQASVNPRVDCAHLDTAPAFPRVSSQPIGGALPWIAKVGRQWRAARSGRLERVSAEGEGRRAWPSRAIGARLPGGRVHRACRGQAGAHRFDTGQIGEANAAKARDRQVASVTPTETFPSLSPSANLPPLQTARQQAIALIAALPDDVPIDEIQYRLHVLEHIRAGIADLDAGTGIPHDEVSAGFARWLDD